jgi:hypothetical protein
MGLKDVVGSLLKTLVAKPGSKAPSGGRRGTSRTKESSASKTERSRGSSSSSTGDVSIGGVTIEYSPLLDGDPDPGEVVWTWVPYEDDPNQGKDRPVVIVGRAGSKLAGVALTSKDYDRGDTFEIGSGSWDSSGRPSHAKLDRILDIDPDAVRREGAILDKGRFDRLIAALSDFHGSTFRR